MSSERMVIKGDYYFYWLKPIDNEWKVEIYTADGSERVESLTSPHDISTPLYIVKKWMAVEASLKESAAEQSKGGTLFAT